MTSSNLALNLAFDLNLNDLYEREGISKIDSRFCDYLKESDVDLYNQLMEARSNPDDIDNKDEGNLLIDLSSHLEDFISELFDIQDEVQDMQRKHTELADLYLCKRIFVQRRASKICKPAEAEALNGDELRREFEGVIGEALTEMSFAKNVASWIEGTKGTDIEGFEENVVIAGRYASWALNNEQGIQKHKDGILFKRPSKTDFNNLVPVETEIVDGVTMKMLSDSHLRERNGFELSDKGASLEVALDQANYCIYCHNQGKDSCSKGLKEKPDAETGKAEFKTSPTRTKLAGCPLEERISEMNMVKAQGFTIGSLAIITVDNPLCAGTGHRICNDCMKACVYQKQEPVDIPQVETRSLNDVLSLPWGFEIYSLLTRWSPFNLQRPIPKKDSGYKVLVAGLGPAGYSLSHHLLNDGHLVVAVDGLKIEPLPGKISGVTVEGNKVAFDPIKDVEEIYENLDDRILAGFGGVAEYGITVRWNKNYLKVIRLLLERRQQFAMYGGVRFGSTLTYDKAFEIGFDHIALCLGAGKPTIVSMPNAMARGVRTASDFLMSLQLSGAGKKKSIANLQLRLPVAVIGGGLTAIDAATESLAYYPVQVEKFLSRYEVLEQELGREKVRENWTEEETEIAEEFLSHAREIRREKASAERKGRPEQIIPLLQKWGGATIAYRRTLQDAPSYRLNHEEVEKAMEEGISFVENVTPVGVRLDKYAHAQGLRVTYPFTAIDERVETREITIPAKTIFMGAGTNPNTVLNREDPKHFEMDHDGWYFKAVDENGEEVSPEKSISKPEDPQVLMSKNDNNKFVSFFGDLHPTYVGNVVKAMGSTKQGYPSVTKVLGQQAPAIKDSAKEFLPKMNNLLLSSVYEVNRLTPTIIEVVIKSQLAAEEFKPGQFYRMQNFESLAKVSEDGTILSMEGLALTGAWVDKEKGLISLIVLEMGGSSNLCDYLEKDEPVILMGPTGEPTEITENETVMLMGGGLGNAVLFSIGKALKEKGNKVLYFAGYKSMQDRYKVEEIEKASDIIIWCCDEGSFEAERPQDKTFHGNIVQAVEAYAKGDLGEKPIDTKDVDRIITIGSDRMMAAVKNARHNVLRDYLKPDHIAIGSINSPMQCMMKEICAQCLQRHIDPETGERYYVYSCFNQDQKLDSVDFQHLNERLKQNNIHEKITAKWISRTIQDIDKLDKAG